MIHRDRETLRRFAVQAAVLAWAALVIFWTFYAIDHFFLAAPNERGLFGRYFAFDPGSDAITALSGLNVAIFGIVITVVSIIVQLSADRYTGVTRMFLRDRLNINIAGYFVISGAVSIWLGASAQPDYVPRLTMLVMLCLTTGGLVILMPYFGYVFWFLEPENLVRHIRQNAIERARDGALKQDKEECYHAQAEALLAMEELADISANSISGKDKIVASAAVDSLKDLAIEYLKVKSQASETWFSIGPEILTNPDFVAMDGESLQDLEHRRTWFEWKVMRQYLSVYNEALGTMRDVNYVIAIDTRYIAEAAAETKDIELIELVYRFMNSYLRATLNARDVRTAYNVLNQYRKMLESMLSFGQNRAAIDGVRHMKYYGLVSFDMDLSFVTETVAYDLSALAQYANEIGSPVEKDILAEFLELDRSPFVRGQERALMGVRKAQVKLAAYYISVDDLDRAKAIARDMKDEPADRLHKIRYQLEAVENKDFWEIIDRGRNFEYMPPKQRECLATFFEWLHIDAEAPAQSS